MGTVGTIKNIIEIGIGLTYLVGAVFNSVYTFNHGDVFYGSFAENALFAPSRLFVKNIVLPYSKIFTILLILFQLLVATSILSRGIFIKPGLIAGAAFCILAAIFSNTSGLIANLIFAAIQFYLVFDNHAV